MKPEVYDMPDADVAWCPGCGNFGILKALKMALADLEIWPENLVLVSGIGQAGKLPHYLKGNVYNGLHGRSLSPATGIKSAHPQLTVVDVSGDGCMYGEGGNHFLHTIRRNVNLTNLVHNNMVYGLTKGQASPTSLRDFHTPLQVEGVFEEPFNPLSVALALGAGFVARAFSGDIERTRDIIKKAILHKGYALVDIFQPCVTFNRVNTYRWFRDNTYYLEDHNPTDRVEAFRRAIETGPYPLGIFYQNPGKKTFEENLSIYMEDERPLHQREIKREAVRKLIQSKKKI
ncbi:2-oxoacid ferredoxin oxidoreductase [Methanobacterium sp. CWC-01]|uniref:thiamine pyrophosphate-dependent enzyme n=1 Tax=Methanobacterium aridiramus TaxID=2584467 RepID=UPI002575881D|nr:thiamine pyrophosphate-dependent enzyme [Methanobacterium sp. CWC-01]WJI08615.1 2-oxoacid ferredoxin oxidoreductase [Methanobacterium sp. CWC-01]